MKTTKIHLADQSFQSQHSGTCNLLLRISAKRISYAIVDRDNDHLKVLFDSPIEKIRYDLIDIIDNDPFLRSDFQQIKISVETSKFTFIPEDIYSESDLESYSLFLQPGEQSDILVKEIPAAKARNIIAIDKSLNEDLAKYFHDPYIFNQANPLIEASLKIYGNSDNNILILQFNKDSFEALLIKSNTLRYYNLFKIENSDEFNYFLLCLINDLQLTHLDTSVILAGDIIVEDDIYKRINKYFNSIDFSDISKLVKGTESFKEIPSHKFFSLIGLHVCG